MDVIGHTGFIWRTEDDQIHEILADSAPISNAERLTGKMNDHWSYSNKC